MPDNQTIQVYVEQIKSMREAAKQLASLNSILPTFYFAVLSFSDLHKTVRGFEALPFLLPIVPWLISLVLIMEIFLPKSLLPSNLEKLVSTYQQRLYWAYWGMVIGLILLLIELGYYLVVVPVPPGSS